METVFKRISGQAGSPVLLCNTFYNNGVPTDPWAILKVEIYKNSVSQANLVAEFIFPEPCDPDYPSPGFKPTEPVEPDPCDTNPTDDGSGEPVPGKYCVLWDVPADAGAPDVYFDVWYFIPTNPCTLPEFMGGTCCEFNTSGELCADFDCIGEEWIDDNTLKCCNRFWIYPGGWLCVDDTTTIRYAFEPLDQRYHKPEVRPLEVGIMPLPLYDNDFNLNMPIIPNLDGFITIETGNKETIVEDAPMEMKIRQGSYRSNPFVLSYLLDTTDYLIGTYSYRVKVDMPDGTSRVSKDFIFTVS